MLIDMKYNFLFIVKIILKITGYSFLLVVFYFLISNVIGIKNHLGIRQHVAYLSGLRISRDTLESISSGMILNKKIKVTYVKDPLNQVKNHIYFWTENPIAEEKYGILPLFHFDAKQTQEVVLHVTSPQQWGDSISIVSFNPPGKRYLDSTKKSTGGYLTLEKEFKDRYGFYDLTDSVGIKFYFVRNNTDTTISFVTLKW